MEIYENGTEKEKNFYSLNEEKDSDIFDYLTDGPRQQNIIFHFCPPSSDAVTIDNAPSIPTLTGTVQGIPGQQYMYNASTVDLDGDPIYYWFDWDDGINTGWLGPFPPGFLVRANHSWSNKGSYEVKVKAKDIFNLETSWATLDVTMPTSTLFDGSFLQAFLKAHPLLSTILSFLFERYSFRMN